MDGVLSPASPQRNRRHLGSRRGPPSHPLPMLGLDTDNGSEFINYEMLRYCQREKITFTRSRSYRKNDQAHVEEKNGSIVRRLVGYDRYEGIDAWQALYQLYVILRQYVNFFQPSMKLRHKERNQGHVSKHYDSAQTPCQRLLSSNSLNEDQKHRLQRQYETLDPVTLLLEMEHRQDRFWNLAHGRTATDSVTRPADKPLESTPETGAAIIPELKIQEGPRYYRRTPRPRGPRYWRTGRTHLSKYGRRFVSSCKSIRNKPPSSFLKTCRDNPRGLMRTGNFGPCSGECGNGAGNNNTQDCPSQTSSVPGQLRQPSGSRYNGPQRPGNTFGWISVAVQQG